jgi:hypothetical protein
MDTMDTAKVRTAQLKVHHNWRSASRSVIPMRLKFLIFFIAAPWVLISSALLP